MDFLIFILSVLTLLLLNIPIFEALKSYFKNSESKTIFIFLSVAYWIIALFADNLAPFLGIIFLLFKVHLKEPENDTIRDFNIWKISASDLAKVSVAAVFFQLSISFANGLFTFLLNQILEFDAPPQEIVTHYAESPVFEKLILFFVIVIFAPFVEEYIFRYFLFDKIFYPKMPAVFDAVLTSAIFTIIHFNIAGIPSFFALGLYCNYVYVKKGYFAAVATHMIFNFIAVLRMTF